MINITIIIPIGFGCLIAGGGLVLYFVKHPEVIDKWLSIIYKLIRFIYKGADKQFVKYGIQSTINDYVAKLNKAVPNLDAQRVSINWIEENVTPEQFLESGSLVLRMHRSTNKNRNIVNATYTFVSHEVLKKAKTYLAGYQKDAIDSVVNLFEGQPLSSSNISIMTPQMSVRFEGRGNFFDISPQDLEENFKKVQEKNGLSVNDKLETPDFTIEMETGTGKTYVYLRTILELNKNYGFSKFVIVVPSIAIKEGVKKTIDITRNHFSKLYNNISYTDFRSVLHLFFNLSAS